MKNILLFLDHPYLFFKYLNELKFRIFYSFLTILISFICCYIYSDQIIYLFTNYLLVNMNSHRFIFTNLTNILITYIKFSLVVSIAISIPIILLHFWLFIVPGLYKHEKQIIDIYLILNFICFYIGYSLAFHFLLPKIWTFFLSFENNNTFFPLHFEAKLEDYLFSALFFILNILITFQLPAILFVLIYLNIISFKFIIGKRKIYYLVFLLLSGLLCPPEIYSQFFFVILLVILYELTLFLIYLIQNFLFHIKK
jgi:sec-independent protein translocase protein TatC